MDEYDEAVHQKQVFWRQISGKTDQNDTQKDEEVNDSYYIDTARGQSSRLTRDLRGSSPEEHLLIGSSPPPSAGSQSSVVITTQHEDIDFSLEVDETLPSSPNLYGSKGASPAEEPNSPSLPRLRLTTPTPMPNETKFKIMQSIIRKMQRRAGSRTSRK